MAAVSESVLDEARLKQMQDRESTVDGCIRSNRYAAAVQAALANPPLGTKNQDIKVRRLLLVLCVCLCFLCGFFVCIIAYIIAVGAPPSPPLSLPSPSRGVLGHADMRGLRLSPRVASPLAPPASAARTACSTLHESIFLLVAGEPPPPPPSLPPPSRLPYSPPCGIV